MRGDWNRAGRHWEDPRPCVTPAELEKITGLKTTLQKDKRTFYDVYSGEEFLGQVRDIFVGIYCRRNRNDEWSFVGTTRHQNDPPLCRALLGLLKLRTLKNIEKKALFGVLLPKEHEGI